MPADGATLREALEAWAAREAAAAECRDRHQRAVEVVNAPRPD